MPIEDEDKAIAEVVDRVAEKFPDVDKDAVADAVEARLEEFEDVPVRDFVPILVEHQVADELRGTSTDD